MNLSNYGFLNKNFDFVKCICEICVYKVEFFVSWSRSRLFFTNVIDFVWAPSGHVLQTQKSYFAMRTYVNKAPFLNKTVQIAPLALRLQMSNNSSRY